MSDNQYTICPFNHQHVLLAIRMPAHIIKCGRTYKGPPLEQCKYNATHRLPPHELPVHEATCHDYYVWHSNDFQKIAKRSQKQ